MYLGISIFIKLIKANLHSDIKISSSYKYRDYMLSNNWIQPTSPILKRNGPFTVEKSIGESFEITSSGKSALFKFSWTLIPILISTIALITSVTALLKSFNFI